MNDRGAWRLDIALQTMYYCFGLSAYFAYKSINDMIGECRRIRETAESAYNQAKDAVNKITQTLTDIREHRDEMAKVKGLYEDFWLLFVYLLLKSASSMKFLVKI